MIEVTRSWTRPNTSVEWDVVPPDLREYIRQTYEQTGKRLSVTRTDSEDQLTRTHSEIWDSENDYNAFQADTSLRQYWSSKRAVYQAAGVTYGPVTITPVA
jgi:hypothetical protein